MLAKTVALRSWDAIHEYAGKHYSGWMFRGQQKVPWELETSLERCCKRHKIPPGRWPDVELRVIREFRRAYHQYGSHVPAPEAIVEWLALMQHHGAPTRLLDFTYSIYVATYFATEEADDDCAVWAIKGTWLLAYAREALKRAGKSPDKVALMFKPFQEGDEEIINEMCFAKPYVAAAWPTNAFRLNERLRIQLGTFLIPSDVSKTFMENLKAVPQDTESFLKIIIPARFVRQARQQLYNMSISRTTLFPGLDGYAKALGVYSPAIRPLFKWDRDLRAVRQMLASRSTHGRI